MKFSSKKYHKAMHKIWLITQREYLTRVMNKAFLLTTFLTPVGFVLFFLIMGFIMDTGSDKTKNIVVIDPVNLLSDKPASTNNLQFSYSEKSLGEIKKEYSQGTFHGILEISALPVDSASSFKVNYHSDEQLAIDEMAAIEDVLATHVRAQKLKAYNLDEKVLKHLDTDISITPESILEQKEISSMTTIISSVIGGIVGYALFFIITLYGSQVMRSVMEEKINRIVEVLISSVRPFELMMGKVIGVGLVGITQIGIWLILIPLIFIAGTAAYGIDLESARQITANPAANQILSQQDKILQILSELKALNWWAIIPLTLYYFLLGYFAYAALFAAVGSAVGEDINEAQSLTLPIMLPLLAAVYIGFSAVSAPDSSLAVYASMIPLLSSIVMPVRIPFGPPVWEIVLSMVLLLIFTIVLIWLAGKIYRVGILMYGKKASFKEIIKWMSYNNY